MGFDFNFIQFAFLLMCMDWIMASVVLFYACFILHDTPGDEDDGDYESDYDKR